MRLKIKEEEANKILSFIASNPNITVGEVSEKFNVSIDIAYYLVKENSKKLSTN